jgi:hypothetical protein
LRRRRERKGCRQVETAGFGKKHSFFLTLPCAGVNHCFPRYSALLKSAFYEKWKYLPTSPGRNFLLPAISAGHFRRPEKAARRVLPITRKIDGCSNLTPIRHKP